MVVVDETVIVVSREVIGRVVADRARWRAWWPDSQVTVLTDRGDEGMTWSLTGHLVGTTEVRLTGAGGGVVVRYSLDADPTEPGSPMTPRRLPDSPHGRRELQSLRQRQALAWKRTVWALKEELEQRVERLGSPGPGS